MRHHSITDQSPLAAALGVSADWLGISLLIVVRTSVNDPAELSAELARLAPLSDLKIVQDLRAGGPSLLDSSAESRQRRTEMGMKPVHRRLIGGDSTRMGWLVRDGEVAVLLLTDSAGKLNLRLADRTVNAVGELLRRIVRTEPNLHELLGTKSERLTREEGAWHALITECQESRVKLSVLAERHVDLADPLNADRASKDGAKAAGGRRDFLGKSGTGIAGLLDQIGQAPAGTGAWLVATYLIPLGYRLALAEGGATRKIGKKVKLLELDPVATDAVQETLRRRHEGHAWPAAAAPLRRAAVRTRNPRKPAETFADLTPTQAGVSAARALAGETTARVYTQGLYISRHGVHPTLEDPIPSATRDPETLNYFLKIRLPLPVPAGGWTSMTTEKLTGADEPKRAPRATGTTGALAQMPGWSAPPNDCVLRQRAKYSYVLMRRPHGGHGSMSAALHPQLVAASTPRHLLDSDVARAITEALGRLRTGDLPLATPSPSAMEESESRQQQAEAQQKIDDLVEHEKRVQERFLMVSVVDPAVYDATIRNLRAALTAAREELDLLSNQSGPRAADVVLDTALTLAAAMKAGAGQSLPIIVARTVADVITNFRVDFDTEEKVLRWSGNLALRQSNGHGVVHVPISGTVPGNHRGGSDIPRRNAIGATWTSGSTVHELGVQYLINDFTVTEHLKLWLARFGVTSPALQMALISAPPHRGLRAQLHRALTAPTDAFEQHQQAVYRGSATRHFGQLGWMRHNPAPHRAVLAAAAEYAVGPHDRISADDLIAHTASDSTIIDALVKAGGLRRDGNLIRPATCSCGQYLTGYLPIAEIPRGVFCTTCLHTPNLPDDVILPSWVNLPWNLDTAIASEVAKFPRQRRIPAIERLTFAEAATALALPAPALTRAARRLGVGTLRKGVRLLTRPELAQLKADPRLASMTSSTLLTRTEAADHLGIPTNTLIYWQQTGLLQEADRTSANKVLYRLEDVERASSEAEGNRRPELLRTGHAARILGMTREGLIAASKRGAIAAVRDGRRWLWDPTAIEEFRLSRIKPITKAGARRAELMARLPEVS